MHYQCLKSNLRWENMNHLLTAKMWQLNIFFLCWCRNKNMIFFLFSAANNAHKGLPPSFCRLRLVPVLSFPLSWLAGTDWSDEVESEAPWIIIKNETENLCTVSSLDQQFNMLYKHCVHKLTFAAPHSSTTRTAQYNISGFRFSKVNWPSVKTKHTHQQRKKNKKKLQFSPFVQLEVRTDKSTKKKKGRSGGGFRQLGLHLAEEVSRTPDPRSNSKKEQFLNQRQPKETEKPEIQTVRTQSYRRRSFNLILRGTKRLLGRNGWEIRQGLPLC